MEHQERGRTAGSAGTPGRAGRDQDDNAWVADTSPGDVRTGAQASEDALSGPGSQRTAAQRGSEGLERVPGMEEQVRRWQDSGTEGMRSRGTFERGGGPGDEPGMDQMARMWREAREEGDPEFRRREEELHARQQDLATRERSLQEREGQLQEREQRLYERQSRYTGRTGGFGAQDYWDDIHIQNRR